jgi:stage V sporulation protein R
VPVLKIEEADYDQNRTLYLKHYHDSRDLQLEHAERCLSYLNKLWGHEVLLETVVNGKRVMLSYSDKGFAARPLK